MVADLLLEMAWKSLVVSACALVAMALMVKRDPNGRVAVGTLGFVSLVALPVTWVMAGAAVVQPIEISAPASALYLAPMHPASVSIATADASATPTVTGWRSLLIWLWAVGAIWVGARLAIGMMTLLRWARTAMSPNLTASQHAAITGLQRPAILLVSDKVTAPLSFGWRRPMILVDQNAMADRRHVDAVIAHEIAHIANHDWLRLIGARIVVAIFWFNPLVWLMEKFYVHTIEEAADASATRTIEPSRYAQALLDAARGKGAPLGANTMAAGSLARRIRQVLQARSASHWDRPMRLGAMSAVALVTAAVVAVQLIAPTSPAFATKDIHGARTSRLGELNEASAIVPTLGDADSAVAASDRAIITERPRRSGSHGGTSVDERFADTLGGPEPTVGGPSSSAGAAITSPTASEERASAPIGSEQPVRVARPSRRDGVQSPEDMEASALSMRAQARDLRAEADRLRDPAYRANIIAAAEAHNSASSRWNRRKVPSDTDLIAKITMNENAARGVETGADGVWGAAQSVREANKIPVVR